MGKRKKNAELLAKIKIELDKRQGIKEPTMGAHGGIIGRPSSYREDMGLKYMEMAKEGCSVSEFCTEVDICKDTFYQWIDKKGEWFKPVFSAFVSRGRTFYQAWWEQTGRQGLRGKDINAQVYNFQMTNRFKDDWKTKNETTLHGGDKPVVVERVVFGSKSGDTDSADHDDKGGD